MEYTAPNSEKVTYNYVTVNYCALVNPEGGCDQYGEMARLQSVANNRGYQIHYNYVSDDPESGPFLGGWLTLASVLGLNTAVDYCDPFAGQCASLTRTWPSVVYADNTSGNPISTDEMSRTTTYTVGYYSGLQLTSVRLPGSTSDDVAVGYNSSGQATSLTDASGAWTYGYSTSGSTGTTTASGPLGQQTVAVSDLLIGRATSVAVATSSSTTSTWNFTYDSQRRLQRTTNPEGDYVEQTYDGRGNVTQITATPKSGSGLSPIVTSAAYPSSCSNVRTCNSPTSTTDARGNVTDYTWDSTHGGLLTVTAPAPSSGADRPQTRYTYAAFNAYAKDSGGSIVSQSPAVTLPTQVSACANGTSCANAANEVRTTVAYGSTGVANNLLPTSVSQGSGASPSMAVTAITYTANGDVETMDGPLSGTADTVTYRYDDARQLTGVVGPDPDGGGGGLNRAQQLTYNSRGQVTLTETGTASGGVWTNFSPLLKSQTTYEAAAFSRPLEARQLSAANAVSSVQQVSYDAAGRPDCTAVRMNPATFGSLPTSACTAATPGSDGSDRIAQTTYDSVGRPLTTTSALGLTEAITEAVTYAANGQTASLTDGNGNGNVSIQEYDGFDRPVKLRYPNASGGGTSATDYEAVGYDAGGNATTRVNRAGQATYVSYDNLNRPILIDAPSGTMDVELTYDNLGRVLTSTGAGQTLTNVWDPLSRLTSETGPLGAMSYQYDARNAMTRIIWPDSFYAQYDRDLYAAVTAIRENGATSGVGVLATYTFNNLGQTTGISRGNGAGTSYGYDGWFRMTSLAHDVSGSGSDVTFGYGYNPAGQIVSRTASNAAYVYAPATGTTSYTNNGLNEVTAVGGGSVTYDANQNITGALGDSYSYDAANRLLSTASTSFGYDPAGRLFSVSSAGIRRQYAGQQAVGDYDSGGTMLSRHVPGPGLDQPVTTHYGSGLSSRMWMLADERLSVISLTDGSAASLNINRYDEYGAPAPGNSDLFQYTGQTSLAPGLYHYRARVYAPQLGRFLQTDPIGYGAGANMYVYVGGDPVNWTDPFGLEPRLYPCGSVAREVRTGPSGPNNPGDMTITYETVYCQVEVGTGSYFEGVGGVAAGLPRADRSRPLPCPSGRYGQASVGAAGSGSGGGRGGSAGVSAGASAPVGGWRGFQLFVQSRMGGGLGVGSGGNVGGEVGIATQTGRLPTGGSMENSSYFEGVFSGGSVTLAGTRAGAQAGASVDASARARAGQGVGAYAITGFQTTTTYATPPLGCE